MKNNVVYLIENIEEYGKLMSFCIENDISVFRTYWDEREKGDRCYDVNFEQKRCFYSSSKYYQNIGSAVIKPKFVLDKYGKYNIERCENNRKE